LSSISGKPKKPAVIAGIFDNKNQEETGLPILGAIDDCVKYCQENKITEIYSTLSPRLYPGLSNIAAAAEKSFIRFKFVPDLSEFIDNKCQIDFIDDTAVVSLRNEPLADVSGRIKKRIFD